MLSNPVRYGSYKGLTLYKCFLLFHDYTVRYGSYKGLTQESSHDTTVVFAPVRYGSYKGLTRFHN